MWRFLRHMARYLRPYLGRFVLGILAGILSGVVEPLLMVAVKIVFDFLFPGAETISFADQLRWAPEFVRHWLQSIQFTPTTGEPIPFWVSVLIVSLVPLVMGLRGFLGYLNTYLLQWVSIRAVADLRLHLFEHLVTRPLGFIRKHHTGELISRVINDTATIQRAIIDTVGALIRDPVKLLSLAGFLILSQPKLSLIALVVVPFCVIPIAIYNRKVRQAGRALQDEYAQLSRVTHESLSGLPVVKAYSMEKALVDRFQKSNRRFVSHYMRVIRSRGIPGPLIETIGAFGVAFLLLYVAGVHQTPMSPGEFLQFIGTIFLMYQPIKNLTRFQQTLVQAEAASRRVFELLEEQEQLTEPSKPVSLEAWNKDIVFQDVSFSYGNKPVLRNVSIRVPAGQMVAIVGPSGAGKTTLTNLLLRFYDPDQGAIFVGDHDLREFSIADLRQQIAVVTQDPVLFDETIEFNIRIGRPDATMEEVIQAAKLAHAHDFIMAKPQGYQTRIGERGVQLSGGEKQRIAIARALLKNAPILILDEATSSLDSESERLVQEALGELMRGRTTICIAHRLATIRSASWIVVLSEGRVVEAGTHEQLMAHGKVYRRFYQLQFAEDRSNL